MKSQIICALLMLGAVPVRAQTTAPPSAPSASAQGPRAHSSQLGFSYSLPRDWNVVDNNPPLHDVQKQVQIDAATDAERRGVNCIQVPLTARRGNPASVVVIVALPFDCFGEQITGKELPGFAQGAMIGIGNALEVSEPSTATYALGTHSLWIERSKASVKGRAETAYTVETVCSVLKRCAACWVAMAADKDALSAFESASVQLDGDAMPALVPAAVFDKKPSQGEAAKPCH